MSCVYKMSHFHSHRFCLNPGIEGIEGGNRRKKWGNVGLLGSRLELEVAFSLCVRGGRVQPSRGDLPHLCL